MYRKLTALVLALALLVAGCGQKDSAVTIIGGADGPTNIIVGKGEAPATSLEEESSLPPAESPPADSSSPPPESSSAASSSVDPASSAPASSSPVSQTSSAPASSSPVSQTSSAPASSSPVSSSQATATTDDQPSQGFRFSTDKVKAGDLTILTVADRSASQLTLTTDLSGAFQFFDVEGEATALIGVSRSTAPGNYKVTVQEQGKTIATLPLTVLDAKFQSQSFQMDQSVQDSTVNNAVSRDEYNKMLDLVTALSSATEGMPNLDSGFIMPIKQQTFKISSSYGYTRIVNGKVSGRHEGVDFPAPAGTPVTASGAGKVLYSALNPMTGNTVVIEHGMGLKTWYCHMSALNCAAGDWVEPGDLLGKVGTTGYSTGNHLHFGMSVNDIYTNPWQFVPYPG